MNREPYDIHSDKTDEELLALSIKKPSVFEHLVRRYEDPFLRKALFLLGSKEDAEDAVQECFTKIYFHAGRYAKQEGVAWSSWAYRILTNTCWSIYQKRKRAGRGRVFLEDGVFENLAEQSFGEYRSEIYERHEKEDLRDAILSFLSRLPREMSRILHMHFFLDMKQKDIALEEGISVSAVKVRIFRAKKELRKLYENSTAH